MSDDRDFRDAKLGRMTGTARSIYCRQRMFMEWLEERGGWCSAPVVSLAINAAIAGFLPARAHAIAMAFHYYDGNTKAAAKAASSRR